MAAMHDLISAYGDFSVEVGGNSCLRLVGGLDLATAPTFAIALEGSAPTREDIAQRREFLGLSADPDRNRTGDSRDDIDVSTRSAAVLTPVVHSREEIVIARAVRTLRAGENDGKARA